ncbi:hypothetical protein BJY21_001073 [Kineosphaera limosa]|uniref:Uncharacterized protein n=1 Tax=Kineosphaera limosa NBRC 100340 TaxID=1184609 RepID=K6W8Q2_9MICO|nr:hypothetical protein [Kineosphaera limosa]NYD99888.1 hypothetical protein [Kineosphaera limosa]GAB95575.1 hypothetical protein KILIM_022_00610 [Kineosphaera limosa NBRC 100340]
MTTQGTTDRPSTGIDLPTQGPDSRRSRRLAVAAVGALTGALLLAGCGSNTPDTAATATAPATQTEPATQSPSTPLSAPNSPATGGQSTAQGTPATKAPTSAATATGGARAQLPTDAGEYGGELISAWQAGDTAAMGDLVTAGAMSSLRGATAPDDLLLTACEDNLCSWSNEAGARLTLTYDSDKVAAGAKHAITAARVSAA